MHELALTPTLFVSFQRYPYPPSGFVTGLPTSCGALPMLADAPGHLLVPSPEGEAFWIGLVGSRQGTPATVRALATLTSGDRVDAVTGASTDRPSGAGELPAGPGHLTVPPAHGLAGISRGDGTWWAFARDAPAPAVACPSLELVSPPAGQVRVDLLAAAEFESLAGTPLPPLDPSGRYGGWRLP
jgi:hypothetical protein